MERMSREVKGQAASALGIHDVLADFPCPPDFKYLTPKIRLDHSSLSIPLVFSKSFHMVCSAARCREIVEGILQRRKDLEISQRPVFVWEPVPNLCCPDELPGFYNAIGLVDIVSPNDSELAAYFGRSTWEWNNPTDEKTAETIVHTGTGIGPNGTGTLVVRAGKHGCYVFSKGKSLHLPACQGVDVVDPTGAGNAFLGALAVGLVSSRGQFLSSVINSALGHQSQMWIDLCDAWGNMQSLPSALACATVAASFVIEQVGMPSVSQSGESEESWNGVVYTERLRQYAKTLKDVLDERGVGSARGS